MSKSASTACSNKSRQRGFTLVELVTIIVILGIVSAVALPRFFDNPVFESRMAADQVKSALRYAQKVAVASRGAVTVNISTAADANCSSSVAGGVINCVIDDGVTVSGTTAVTFDWMGRPVPNVATALTVGTTTINIAAETGYVSYVQ